MGPLRIGLIGGGKHGSRYARHLCADLPDRARLAVLCRRDEDAGAAAAREYGCRFTSQVGDVVTASDIDAVIVVVPPTLHAQICEQAIGAGKAVLLEKPMAPTLDDADRIRRALERSPVPFMVAHTLRFNSVVRTLRDRLGEIAPVHTLYLSQRFEPSRLAWLDDRAVAGGGIVIHTGVHSFDLVRFFAATEVVSAWCRMWRRDTNETEDNFAAHLTLDGGVQAIVTGSRSTAGRNGLIEIVGERGQLVGDHTLHFAYVIRERTRTEISLPERVPTVLATLRAFVDALSADEAPPIGWQDGRAAVAVAEACYQSAAQGVPVPVAAPPDQNRGETRRSV